MKQNLLKTFVIVLIVALCAVCFTACVPTDYNKAKANLEANGYSVALVENDGSLSSANAAASIFAAVVEIKLTGTCTQIITAYNEDNSVMIYYFDNSKDASAFKKAFKTYAEKRKAELKEQKENGEITEAEYNEEVSEIDNAKIGSFSKVFWMGTAGGVKAAG